jgi:hypothetical protein
MTVANSASVHRTNTCTVALLLSATLIVGCGSGVKTTGTVTTPTSPTSPTSPTTTKAPLHGLVSMNSENFVSNPALTPDNTQTEPNADPNVYVASVILVTWEQLQPTNGTTLNTTAIESGLAAIASYNTAHPGHTMVGKLRVFAGLNTPAWALAIDGGPVTATINGTTGSLAKFWTADYATAWTNLQTQLAAVYDKDARIGEVAVSGCSSRTAEPFIFTVDPSVIAVAQAAGYTDAQFETCLSTMATQYAAWTVTPLDYSFNPFNHIDSGVAVTDTNFPIQLMTAWRATLGTARGVLANHGLQMPLTTGATPLYAEFTVLGPPLEFQTYGPAVNWPQTIAYGLTFNPTEIEIWQTTQGGGYAVITLTQLQQWAAEL